MAYSQQTGAWLGVLAQCRKIEQPQNKYIFVKQVLAGMISQLPTDINLERHARGCIEKALEALRVGRDVAAAEAMLRVSLLMQESTASALSKNELLMELYALPD